MPKEINFKRIKEISKKVSKIPRWLGENPFVAFLIFLFIALIIGGLIFYRYRILIRETEEQPVFEKPFQIDEKSYERVLGEWKAREERFKQTGSKIYPNPFREPILVEAQTATP